MTSKYLPHLKPALFIFWLCSFPEHPVTSIIRPCKKKKKKKESRQTVSANTANILSIWEHCRRTLPFRTWLHSYLSASHNKNTVLTAWITRPEIRLHNILHLHRHTDKTMSSLVTQRNNDWSSQLIGCSCYYSLPGGSTFLDTLVSSVLNCHTDLFSMSRIPGSVLFHLLPGHSFRPLCFARALRV